MPVLPEELLGIVASFTPRAVSLARAGRAWWRAAGEHFWRAVLKTCQSDVERWRWVHRGLCFRGAIPASLVARFPALGALAPWVAEKPPPPAHLLRDERDGDHVFFDAEGVCYPAAASRSFLFFTNFREDIVVDRQSDRVLFRFDAGYYACEIVADRYLARVMAGSTGLCIVDLRGVEPPRWVYERSQLERLAVVGEFLAVAGSIAGHRSAVALLEVGTWREARCMPAPYVHVMRAHDGRLWLNGSFIVNIAS